MAREVPAIPPLNGRSCSALFSDEPARPDTTQAGLTTQKRECPLGDIPSTALEYFPIDIADHGLLFPVIVLYG